MVRLVVAALVAAISLQAWGEVSSRLLPWPAAKSSRMAPLPLADSGSERNLSDSIAVIESSGQAGSSFAPPRTSSADLLAANSTDWPLYAFQRSPRGLTPRAASAHLALNIILGLVAVLLVTVLFRKRQPTLRRAGVLGLIALFLILMTDVSQGLWMEWPNSYIVVLATDHGVGTLLAVGTAGTVLWLWNPGLPQSAAPAS